MTALDADAVDDAPSTAEAPPIRVTGLVSRFGDNVIHDGLDLTAERGEVLGVVGGSGAGKSVLLNTIIGLKVPDGGSVKLFGQDMADASRRRWNVIERRWGVLFQQGALFSNLTVRENVAAPLHEHTRLPKREIDHLADLKIALVGLPASGRQPQARRAVGRHAQARGPGPGPGHGPRAAVPGRADGGP
jgi:phospholipid/cholesterol/gamma-HCH transport system ATP-binding protein